MKVSVNNMYKLNVYTCKYLNEKYGYSFNNNEIIAINNGDDDTPFILVINNDGSMHVYGAKQSMLVDNVVTACDETNINCLYRVIVLNICHNINDIDRIKSICTMKNVSFNDIEVTPVEYIKSHVYDFENANALTPFNCIACDNNAIGIITMLFSDNNNTTGQYRIIIRDDLLTCIQYINTEIGAIHDLISVNCCSDKFCTLDNCIYYNIDFIAMSLHYYMNVLKYSIEN